MHSFRRSPLAAACTAMLVSYLPFSAVNGSLGTIAAATSASPTDLQWATDAFAAALTSVVLAAGALGGRYGHRTVAVAGLVLTALGAVFADLTGVAGMPALWTGQALAGVGAGLVMSTTLALVSATALDRSRAIAVWAGALVLGLGSGPFLAAAATAVAPWWTMFVPVAVAALASAAWLRAAVPRPAPAPAGAALDRLGFAFGIAAIAATTIAIIQGGLPPAVVAVTLIGAFIAAERRAAAPVLDLSLFRLPAFDAAGLAAAAILFTIAGMVFVLGLFFSAAQHASPLHVALLLGCIFAANAAGGPVAARLERRTAARVPLLIGLVLAAGGTLAVTTVTPASGIVAAVAPLAALGFGAGLVMSTASAVAVDAVAGPAAPMAGAANNVLRQLGATLGPALLGAIVAAHTDLTVALHAAAQLAALVLLAAAAAAAALLHIPTSHNKEQLT